MASGVSPGPFDVRTLLAGYERGIVTRNELLIEVVKAATGTPPRQIAPLLPAELLGELRERAEDPPQDRDRIAVVGIVTLDRGADVTAHWRQESRYYNDGLWAWHCYFRCPDNP